MKIAFGVGMWIISCALLMIVGAPLPLLQKLMIFVALGCAYLGGVSFAERNDRQKAGDK